MLDIFNNNAFSLVAIQALLFSETLPQEFGQYFEKRPISTTTVAIEKKGKVLSLIPTSERGSPVDEATNQKRDIRDFRTTRLAKSDTLYASELQDVRAFGETQKLNTALDVFSEKVVDLENDLSLSFEAQYLGALKGNFIDPKSGAVIYNWFTEFEVTQAPEVAFDFANATTGQFKKKCNAEVRRILKALGGARTTKTRIKAYVGSDFWDDMTTCQEVRDTYLNWSASQDLRNGHGVGGAFKYGGIEWHEYLGTDDDKVSIEATKCIIFPINVRGNLVHAMSPGETFGAVNTRGKEKYLERTFDPITPTENRKWVKATLYAYPLMYVARPESLGRGRAGA